MQCSQSPDQIQAVHTHDATIGVAVLQNLQRAIVGRVAKCRHQNSAVHQNVIAVAGWQSGTILKFWSGHGERDRLQMFSGAANGGGHSFKILSQVVCFRSIFAVGSCHKHAFSIHEAGRLVDVTVCVIAFHATSRQPDDAFGLQPDLQDFCHDFASHREVAVGVQQARFRGHDGALPVSLDGTTFQSQAGSDAADSETCCDATARQLIVIPRRVFAAPRVVVPVNDHLRSRGWSTGATVQKNRAVIATPRIIDRNIDQFRRIATALATAGGVEQRGSGGCGAIAARQNSHGFELSDGGGEFGKRRRDAFKDAWPRVGVHGPRGPGGDVRLPFRRPAIVGKFQHVSGSTVSVDIN